MIYENGKPKTLLTENGYVSLNDYKYHYYLQDHQGNNRVIVNQNGTVEEVNHYYPFGGTFASTSSVQPYKYNGKELDTKNGLNWYDYGARQYDAAIGRWHAVDAMAEKYSEVTPYAYCGNNSINRIDPDGKDWRVQTRYNEETKKIEYAMTVNAVLYNNSSNKNINMNLLASSIIKQINSVYTTSGANYISTMDFNMKVVNSIDEIGETDHVFQVVDQKDLDATYPQHESGDVLASGIVSGLGIRISSELIGEIISGSNTRTISHELGHTGGLHDLKERIKKNRDRLMMQAVNINILNGIPNKATYLPHSDIKAIRDNYIQNKLNHNSPIRKWYGRKIIRK